MCLIMLCMRSHGLDNERWFRQRWVGQRAEHMWQNAYRHLAEACNDARGNVTQVNNVVTEVAM